jgi:hypothetical protein
MNDLPTEIPALTTVLYMHVTGLTVGDQHWPVTGRGEFVYAQPAMPLPEPGDTWRDLVADGHNVAATVSFTFTPDNEIDLVFLAPTIQKRRNFPVWASGVTLSDGRPVTVMLTGYNLDVCTLTEMRWSATHLPDNPPVVRFGVLP